MQGAHTDAPLFYWRLIMPRSLKDVDKYLEKVF